MTLEARQEPDNAIVDMKYRSPQIGAMAKEDFFLLSKKAMLQIHVITGWTIPEGDLWKILLDQFQKHMLESYPDINMDEIEHAFRANLGRVKDWGKAMNITLIDQVISPYVAHRAFLSQELESRSKEPPPQRIYSQEENDNLHRADVEAFYQRLRNGWIPGFVPQYFKEILVKDGLIREKDRVDLYFADRLNHKQENIYLKQQP